ncbi:unnamed protein product, partial [Ostreobium quekettii]
SKRAGRWPWVVGEAKVPSQVDCWINVVQERGQVPVWQWLVERGAARHRWALQGSEGLRGVEWRCKVQRGAARRRGAL